MNPRRDEWILGSALFWVIALLIVPLPAFLLDGLLALSLTLGLMILLVALFSERPLEFSVFPSLLLIVTLLRLGLNVASTRLILTRGAEGTDAAGRLIQAFGDIAIGGNTAVGIILFLIFVTINFVVIAKGSGRIAEVAARFTLDSMPGKQMAIDADLNQGLLEESDAKRRRQELQREADFYGAMDGASKFVKGDAIAGLLIVGVNIVGGLAIGVAQSGMPIGEAFDTYTALTVGDGLVGQVPALIVSTAAGIVVSRAAAGQPLGAELAQQVLMQPRALTGAATMLAALALAPGLPFAPFALLAAGTGGLAVYARNSAAAQEAADAQAAAAPRPEGEPAPEPRHSVGLDELELEIGYGVIALVDEQRGGDLLARIRATRRHLATELGFVVPLVHIRDNLGLDPNEYRVLVRGNPVASSTVPPGRSLAIHAGGDAPRIAGIATEDPAFGLPAVWIQNRDREAAEAAGCTVVDASSAIATHLAEVVRQQASELLTRHQVRELLDAFSEGAPRVVEDIVPAVVSLSVLHRVMRSLLDEGVSVRDLGAILETLAEYAAKVEDPDLLTDLVRERLGRTIVKPLLGPERTLSVLTIEADVEERLRQGVQRSPGGSFLAVEPTLLDQFLNGLAAALDAAPAEADDRGPAILTGQTLRSPLRQLLARRLPRVPVLAHNELPGDVRVVARGQVRLSHAH